MTLKDNKSRLLNVILIIYTILSTLSYFYLFYQVESLSHRQQVATISPNTSSELALIESRFEKTQSQLQQKVISLDHLNDSIQASALLLEKQHQLLQQKLATQNIALQSFVDSSGLVVIDSSHINDSLLLKSLSLNDSLVYSDSLCSATNQLLIRVVFTQDSIIGLKDSLLDNCNSSFKQHRSYTDQLLADNLSLKNNLHQEHLKSKVLSVGCILLSGALLTSFLIQ